MTLETCISDATWNVRLLCHKKRASLITYETCVSDATWNVCLWCHLKRASLMPYETCVFDATWNVRLWWYKKRASLMPLETCVSDTTWNVRLWCHMKLYDWSKWLNVFPTTLGPKIFLDNPATTAIGTGCTHLLQLNSFTFTSAAQPWNGDNTEMDVVNASIFWGLVNSRNDVGTVMYI